MKEVIKILAIDDEQVILDSIVKLCSMEGWQVETVTNAIDAMEKINKDKYNLLLCDIKMPEMDGFELLEKLRDKEIKTPVIITTGFSTVENAVRSLYTGAIDFLPKPFTFDELISCIKRGLNYASILKRIESSIYRNKDKFIIYIPCPPKYKRLGYTSWCYLEDDGSVKIGITDLFLRTVDAIEKIQLSNIDDEIIQGTSCCQVFTKDQLIHNVLAPLSGRVIRKNEQVLENYTLCEKDPYFEGWLYVIVPMNLDYESKHLVPCSSDRI